MRETIINDACVAIYADEGFENFIYKDTEGIPTEGIGFKVSALTEDEQAILAKGITLPNCLLILGMKLNRVYDELCGGINFFTVLPDNCQIALLDLAYQIGTHGLLEYHRCLLSLEHQDYVTAGKEILDSKEATQTPNRAKRIHDLIIGN